MVELGLGMIQYFMSFLWALIYPIILRNIHLHYLICIFLNKEWFLVHLWDYVPKYW